MGSIITRSENHTAELNCAWRDEGIQSLGVAGSAHLWMARLDRNDASLAWFHSLLSDEEWRRGRQYRIDRDRNRFIARRGALRVILARYLQMEPRAVPFRTGEFGKLHLAHPCHSTVEFNLTHSQEIALIAVAHAGCVGVDLERVRPLSDLDLMIRSCLSPAEQSNLEALPAASRLEYFFRYWTCKEAYLKALGVGLNRSLPTVQVSLAASDSDQEVSIRTNHEAASKFSVRSFVLLDGYVAATVASRG